MELRFAACLALASVSPGCSWIFTSGPPDNHAQLPFFTCSTNYAPPVLDTIWGSLNLLGAMAAAGATDEEVSYDRDDVMTSGLIWAAISGLSAYYGYSKVSECREATEELAGRYQPPAYYAPRRYQPSSPPPPPPSTTTPPRAPGVEPEAPAPPLSQFNERERPSFFRLAMPSHTKGQRAVSFLRPPHPQRFKLLEQMRLRIYR